MIEFLKGDCLQNSDTKRVIAHIVNNKGGFGAGFALAVSKRYPIVKERYKKWYHIGEYKSSKFNLGDIQVIQIDDHLTFVSMLAQNGYTSKRNPVPLNYETLEKCLMKLNRVESTAEIWMPKIGSGLAGGDWKEIEEMLNYFLKDRVVKVFEL